MYCTETIDRNGFDYTKDFTNKFIQWKQQLLHTAILTVAKFIDITVTTIRTLRTTMMWSQLSQCSQSSQKPQLPQLQPQLSQFDQPQMSQQQPQLLQFFKKNFDHVNVYNNVIKGCCFLERYQLRLVFTILSLFCPVYLPQYILAVI